MANLIGQELGGYQIAEQIGQGGMATVYKAYEAATDRYVALKILPHQYSHDTKFIERFRREARALAKLEHIHILPIHAYGEQDGIIYLAMRYIPTGSLKDRIKQQGAFSLHEASRLLSQIAGALDHAHQHGILHRDVKPANVLLDSDENAYLTDFGIARMVGATADLTGDGIIGTPAYMPPEQLEENAEIVPASDQYALGVVLYEMVTGRTPYQAETPVAMITKKLTTPLPPPRAFNPELPEAAELVILKALAANPAARFQSCYELADQFAAALEGMPVDVQPPAASPDDMTYDSLPGTTASTPTAAPSLPTVAARQGMPIWLIGLIALLGIGVIGAAIFFGLQGNRKPTALDPTQVLAIAVNATQTGDAVLAATNTQEAKQEATARAYAVATSDAQATSKALTPTQTLTPTITPTPIPTTETGLYMYDDFDQGESLNGDLWVLGNGYFEPRDGVLAHVIDKGAAADGDDPTLHPLPDFYLADSGPLRFALESKIQASLIASGTEMNLKIELSGPGSRAFQIGYLSESGSFQYYCQGWDSESESSTHFTRAGSPTFDAWHTFRISIEEILDSGDLAYRGYVDGEQICESIPPADWQSVAKGGDPVSFWLGSYWTDETLGIEGMQLLAIYFDGMTLAYYDDVAIWPWPDR